LIEELEQKLDSFNPDERKQALLELRRNVERGEITLPQVGTDVNLHCHTFFSYNSYGYSPSKFAWEARKQGLAVAGVVDFDVLDALEEFLEAARLVELKACAGLETRVFVPEFADRVINSPGEPGISYHMGVGFPTARLHGEQLEQLKSFRQLARQRNEGLMQRVNDYLPEIALDYEHDVLALTPSGNATERHICLAYARKAEELFGRTDKLAQFWQEKLRTDANGLELPEGRSLLDTLRKKTMKQGGVGYVRPDHGSFPLLADVNRFAYASGAIPTATWLNGLSEGEQAEEEYLRLAMSTGTAALNIIPDRNYTEGVRDQKLKNLYAIVELAKKLHLPLIVGTEMNSPGQKFVDNFQSAELSPLVPEFLKGAHIAYAHSVLQNRCALGYTSSWARDNFASVAEKNEFFQQFGSTLMPKQEDITAGFSARMTPPDMLKAVES